MPVTLNIIESVTELGQEVVEVVLASASTPGPAGPGVPTGGTDGQVLTKASATDYDTAWEDPTGGAGGAPTDATYLVTAAHGDLSAEVVVGATPGGELGGTWASPTVDATHSGSSHAAVQAAAEATAAAALSAHSTDTTSVHGIADTSALALTANHPTNATFNDHSARHENGGADEISIAGLDGIPAELQAHLDDTTDAHDASAVSVDSTNLSGTAIHVQGSLEELDNLLDDHSARHEDGGADEISIQGLAGTPTELTNHLNDATDAHDASAISLADVGGNTTETEVEGAIAELYGLAGGSGGSPAVVLATFGYTVVQGTWTKAYDPSQQLAFYLFSSTDAQNDEVTYKVLLGAGTYTIELLHVTNNNRGIYTISIDGVSAGTIDGYSAGNTYNIYSAITGVTVSVSGLKTISVKMATKNASSSAYRAVFSALVFHRTA